VYLSEGEIVEVSAVFHRQYELNVSTPYSTAEGSGWYDEGSPANFNISNVLLPIPGVLGRLGGKLHFKGWYEGGALITDSNNGTITMDKPHSLTALWLPDYSTPIAVVSGAVLVLVSVVVFLLLIEKKNIFRTRSKTRKESKNVALLERLEELHSSGRIREELYQKLKKEYEAN
jgi:hypothetical protein